MQTFAEFIADSFRSEANVNWSIKSTTHAVAKFAVRSITVAVDFEQREAGGPWHVSFNATQGGLDDFRNETSAFRTLNGVFQAVREFIEAREPDSVALIAKDEDRASIYAAYLRRERASVESLGYTVEGPHSVHPHTEWTLRRVRPTTWQ